MSSGEKKKGKSLTKDINGSCFLLFAHGVKIMSTTRRNFLGMSALALSGAATGQEAVPLAPRKNSSTKALPAPIPPFVTIWTALVYFYSQ